MTTRQAITENPQYKVILFTSAEIPGVLSLNNRVELEVPPSNVGTQDALLRLLEIYTAS